MKRNILLSTDSYKFSHSIGINNTEHQGQYPPGAEGMQSYIEARGGDHLVFFGLQMFIKDYLLTPITQADIEEAELFCKAHGVPFNKQGFEYILTEYKGYMPVTIKALPEGTVIKNRNCLLTICCTDPVCFWIVNFLETALLRAIWYPSSVATVSYDCKKVIKDFLERTSDVQEQVAFKLHDFGGRGCSSGETAGIGGAAHLVNFLGSDTVEGVQYANHYYGAEMAGFSIPAAEHSTITSWGKDNEVEAYRNMLKQYGGPGKLVAVVSDSYDIFKACELWGTELKADVEALGAVGGTLVIRPDSGDPAPTVRRCVEILAEKFGTTRNSKGYKVLPPYVRVIQGDGINKASINEILATLKWAGFSADNVAFGMGGALLQHVNRDTYGFAMKCCALLVNGKWIDVFKEAPGKESKRGRLTVVEDEEGKAKTVRLDDQNWEDKIILNLVYTMTKKLYEPFVALTNFEKIRENANKPIL
jgi:nicotinamide phosphoribosyltransferase